MSPKVGISHKKGYPRHNYPGEDPQGYAWQTHNHKPLTLIFASAALAFWPMIVIKIVTFSCFQVIPGHGNPQKKAGIGWRFNIYLNVAFI